MPMNTLRKTKIVCTIGPASRSEKVMTEMLSKCKNLNICENNVKILSALNDESKAQLWALANEL